MDNPIGTSSMETRKFVKFIWTVKRYKIETSEFIKSPVFMTDVDDIETSFFLRAYKLSQVPSGKVPVNCINSRTSSCKFWEFNVEELIRCYEVLISSSVDFTLKIETNGSHYTKEIKEKRIYFCLEHGFKLLKDVKFSIICEIIRKNTECILENMTKRLKQFDGFESLLQDDKYSDVTIVVGDERLPAHKCILSNRSPVFAAMFNTDMLESKYNVVEIKDFTGDVIKELLRFLYSGRVGDIAAFVEDVFRAADKYFVESLKVICEGVMRRNINENNVDEYLSFAHCYGLTELKKSARKFIAEYEDDLKRSK